MSEMVERVAKAICKSHGLHPDADAFGHGALRHYPIWNTYEQDSRAAIESMREPTAAMIAAARAKADAVVDPDELMFAFQRMIDEALK